MTFAEFIAERARLDAAVEAASAALQPFPRNAMGLTPDDVKASPEWKAAHAAYWRAHGQLRAFNGRYAPMFKAELRAARRARRNPEFFPLTDLDAWEAFWNANVDALAEIGDKATCYALACNCNLVVGGGAAPLFRIGFVD